VQVFLVFQFALDSFPSNFARNLSGIMGHGGSSSVQLNLDGNAASLFCQCACAVTLTLWCERAEVPSERNGAGVCYGLDGGELQQCASGSNKIDGATNGMKPYPYFPWKS
jgi:hypothetical protein